MAPREIQDAAYFFIQLVNEGKVHDTMLCYELCAKFAEICNWTTADSDMLDVRQNTTYGIGAIARVLPPAQFKTLLPGSQQALDLVLSHPEAATEEVQGATENALITLGILALLHSKEEAQVSRFLAALPLKGEEEAQEAHELLLDQLLAGNAALTSNGQTQAAVQRIRAAVAANGDLLTAAGKTKLESIPAAQ